HSDNAPITRSQFVVLRRGELFRMGIAWLPAGRCRRGVNTASLRGAAPDYVGGMATKQSPPNEMHTQITHQLHAASSWCFDVALPDGNCRQAGVAVVFPAAS
ncbi:MAG: hypothetical protein C0490_21440, partial [Marivirga sp.]|nr:hypothetical protein [Marivirga sp.]